jgi:hypothetical protein
MLRRTYLATITHLSALPFVSSKEGDVKPTPTEIVAEGNMMYWFYFRNALTKERVMNTPESRVRAVKDVDLVQASDEEAIELLKRANNGEYTLDDIPTTWREYFDGVEEKFKLIE